jgi:hypothetical protein
MTEVVMIDHAARAARAGCWAQGSPLDPNAMPHKGLCCPASVPSRAQIEHEDERHGQRKTDQLPLPLARNGSVVSSSDIFPIFAVKIGNSLF